MEGVGGRLMSNGNKSTPTDNVRLTTTSTSDWDGAEKNYNEPNRRMRQTKEATWIRKTKHQLTKTRAIMSYATCTMTSFILVLRESMCNVQWTSPQVKETSRFGYENWKCLICVLMVLVSLVLMKQYNITSSSHSNVSGEFSHSSIPHFQPSFSSSSYFLALLSLSTIKVKEQNRLQKAKWDSWAHRNHRLTDNEIVFWCIRKTWKNAIRHPDWEKDCICKWTNVEYDCDWRKSLKMSKHIYLTQKNYKYAKMRKDDTEITITMMGNGKLMKLSQDGGRYYYYSIT